MDDWTAASDADGHELDKELQVATLNLSSLFGCQPGCEITSTLLHMLQRVASQLEQQAGLQSDNFDAAEVFATEENWQTCADDLNASLAGIDACTHKPAAALCSLWIPASS